MKDKKQLLDDALAGLEFAIRRFRQALKSDLPLPRLIDQFKPELENFLASFALLDQDHQVEQRRQVLTHMARFIREKIDNYENPLRISQSAAYFMCKENDLRLRIELSPSKQTRRLISAAAENLLAVKVHYERMNDNESCLRKTEIFSMQPSSESPVVTYFQDEIHWKALALDVCDAFLQQGKSKVSYQIYPSEE